MVAILAYTFRTFPHRDELSREFGEVFVFGKLRDDMTVFGERVLTECPRRILGVAMANSSSPSAFESVCINRFGTRGYISREGEAEYRLHVPEPPGPFVRNDTPTSAHCNWTMYRISETLSTLGLAIPLSFAHLRPEDIPSLRSVLTT
jgi:hypothetical protein